MFGRFADLLLASTHHPTMLLYLDQVKSIGPNSRRSAAAPPKGLNENLAREVMELHSLGVDAGYTQNDVTEMARALTGWTRRGSRVRAIRVSSATCTNRARGTSSARPMPRSGENQATRAR